MKEFDDVNSGNFFSLSDFTFRSHSLKLYKLKSNLNVNKFNFCKRMVDVWNRLDQSIIDSGTNSPLEVVSRYTGSAHSIDGAC